MHSLWARHSRDIRNQSTSVHLHTLRHLLMRLLHHWYRGQGQRIVRGNGIDGRELEMRSGHEEVRGVLIGRCRLQEAGGKWCNWWGVPGRGTGTLLHFTTGEQSWGSNADGILLRVGQRGLGHNTATGELQLEVIRTTFVGE